MHKPAVVAFLAILVLISWAVNAGAQSGQMASGQSTTEPAVNDADGSTVFLHTPNAVSESPNSNPRAHAPMYIPMYPVGSMIDRATLNCQPHNCNHLNVLPFTFSDYPNGGSTCASLGLPAGACSLVIGHDHLIGVPHTGDFNVTWHVILVVFTHQGFLDHAIDQRALTLQELSTLVTKGDAVEISTPVTFDCAIVSSAVYFHGVPVTVPF